MTTIYRDNASRLSVADAKRLILDALPPETYGEIYAQIDENGEIDSEGRIDVKVVHGVQIYASFIDRDFSSTCNQLSIQPRMKYRPAFTDYSGDASQDDYYTIAHDEFLSLAKLFNLLVVMGVATEVQAMPVLANDAPEKQINAMKKAALIAKLEYEWPSIEADISDATRNGLKAAAHTGKHGEWDADKARAWAVSKGKIKQTAPVHHLASAWPGATTRHTISR